MRKLILFIIIISLGIFAYFKFFNSQNIDVVLDNLEDEYFNVERYTIFGTHFNIQGCMDKKLDGLLELVLKNKDEELKVDTLFMKDTKTCFKLSDKNNEGINLEDLKEGNFVLLVKQTKEEEKKYYSLKNNTNYNNLTYYTISNNFKNNKIEIKFNIYKEKDYLSFNISEEKLPNDVYDITIDPGHGGKDPGASYKYNGKVYNESELTLRIALLLKKDLEDQGFKVKLTRTSDIMLNNYGIGGRSSIPNEVKSKYSLSIHLNSYSSKMTYGGVEVYTPNDINYEFADLLALNISEIVGYSKKNTEKINNGVYYTSFSESDILESNQGMIDDGLKPYDIKLGSPYMFMIREVGGICTYAYVDGRNPSHGINNYSNSNQTAEPYLIELGYINYDKDIENLENRSDLFSKAITNAIKEYLKSNKNV